MCGAKRLEFDLYFANVGNGRIRAVEGPIGGIPMTTPAAIRLWTGSRSSRSSDTLPSLVMDAPTRFDTSSQKPHYCERHRDRQGKRRNSGEFSVHAHSPRQSESCADLGRVTV
jgi:hypothetical protein